MNELLSNEINVVTAGAPLFAEELRSQNVRVEEIQWRPYPQIAEMTRIYSDSRLLSANQLALSRMLASEARLVDIKTAEEALELEKYSLLHAGPPIDWDSASGPLRGALIGAVLFEGWADNPESAEKLLSEGRINLEPCHHYNAVGPMAGVVTPSMHMFEVFDQSTGNKSFCTLNEGLGKVLRYGAFSAEVISRLNWMRNDLGPLLQLGIRSLTDGIDVKAILAQMIQMGDEGHNRNRAGTLMFMRDIFPSIIDNSSSSQISTAMKFIGGNDHFFLNLVMPTCKLQTLAAANIPGSTIVTVMARNGTEFGIQTSGTGKDWFTGPAQVPHGLYLGNYTADDANPDIGDSAITETAGVGGFSMAAAPAIVKFIGGVAADALAATQRMYQITVGENPLFGIPIMEFRGAPTGIDATLVVRTGILPQINTGMAGKVAGTGQVGAGLVTPPMECFTKAIAELAKRV